MGVILPEIARDAFERRLAAVSPEPLSSDACKRIYAHYLELRRWNPVLSLVGPGTADAVVERHYGEALAALPLLPRGEAVLVDLGAGAGFPGVVLAAARLDLRTTLVESRERKWAFLEAACRRAALPCACLNARLEVPLPAGLPPMLDVLTVRALKLPPEVWAALGERLSPSGQILRWAAADAPPLPVAMHVARRVALAGSDRRELQELVR
jgi:16S rRNA (guanine527-N7)-methyltransferase